MTLAYDANRQPASTSKALTTSHLADLLSMASYVSVEAWLKQSTCSPSSSESSENRDFSYHSWSLRGTSLRQKSLPDSPYSIAESGYSEPCVGSVSFEILNYIL